MYQGIIRHLFTLFLALTSLSYVHAQSSFIPLNDDYYHLIDRLEIKRGKLSEGFNYNIKPFERKAVVSLTDSILKEGTVNLTDRDWETIDYIREDSWEWTNGMISTDSAQYNRLARLGWFKSPPPGKKRKFWEHPADLYSIHNKDFDLHFNFVTTNFIGKDNSYDTTRFNTLWGTSRGVEIRGMINNKLGFYTYVADNQGRFPRYIGEHKIEDPRFPGEGLAKYHERNGSFDFLTARGYITFRPLKSVNVKFGHDYNVFGSGYRSLILSDNSSPYLFLRLDTQLGKFHYTNLWTSMTNTGKDAFAEELRRKKFAAIHHLSVNVTDKLNIGVFEAEVFNRDSVGGGYDLNYLNPIIFYRYVESYIGSQDNALLGLDFRWLAGKTASVYGQFVLDEFLSKELFNGSKFWGNKYSLQLGAKYVDAFGVPNLDFQAEFNLVRPYTYSHKDGGRNYMHYGQALAHPLGANFREFVGILRYKATSRLTVYGTLMSAMQGKNPTTGDYMNFGGDISKNYEERSINRNGEYGQKIGQGIRATTLYTDLRLTYSLAHNLFLDGRYLIRKISSVDKNVAVNSNIFTFAIRYNMAFRQQTF
ncbi:capsule assembly Wzi family protein [Dyadobacter luticola]|uniref:Capsule assembly Wzi family protein n=1 Tax=Dyadobacter luticola TaxID=1979387 RepID=A0A5R9KV42_9BACT|nr:capsule assembly Wzi family protein [Dyadobacter luticola]TLV00020.1 capsule assembly Wzi family protein [Dyadobacter luticola]